MPRPSHFVIDGKKLCTECKESKPVSEFNKAARLRTGYDVYCKPCKRARTAVYNATLASAPLEHEAAKFWPKVNKEAANGCWEWTASLDGRGYGQFWFRGKLWKAYRVALFLERSIEPPKRKDGMCVDHICRNALCVNPDHLRVVTDAVNGLENNSNPWAKNLRKTHCVNGHPFSGENLARVLVRSKSGKKWTPARQCLTCYPSFANHRLRFWLPGEFRAE